MRSSEPYSLHTRIIPMRSSSDGLALLVLVVLTLWTSLWRFPRVTLDSHYYLNLVAIFQGDLPIALATPPYCYRPLMPLIVSLFATDPLYTWATISVILNLCLVPVVYYLVKSFGVRTFGAFAATGITTVGIMSIMWGSWVGADLPALLCMGAAFLIILRYDTQHAQVGALLLFLIGTLFKEFVILGPLVWLFWAIQERDGNSVIVAIMSSIVCAMTYISVRWFWQDVGVSGGYFWRWNDLFNFTMNLDKTIETLVLGFMFFIPAIIIALIEYPPRAVHLRAYTWFVACLPLWGYFFAGLFMAYFDLRFVWPLYLGMAPLAGIAGDVVGSRFRDFFHAELIEAFISKEVIE